MSSFSDPVGQRSVYQNLMMLLVPQTEANRLESLSALPQDIKERMSKHYLEMTQSSLSDRIVEFDLLKVADLNETVQKLTWEIFTILSPMEKEQVALKEQSLKENPFLLLQRMSEYLGDWTPGAQTKINLWAQNQSHITQPLLNFLKKKEETKICLEEFNLHHLPCNFSDIPFCRRLSELDLRNNEFSEFPKEIFSLSALKELNLSCNRLDSVPEQIGLLSNLTTLVLSYNEISSLPNAIGMLPNLKFLYLSDNQLSLLPPNMSQLHHLQMLSLNGNQLSTFPEEIGLLPQLTSLDLSDNSCLRDLPNSILHRGLNHLGLVRTAFSEQQRGYLESLQASSPIYAGISFLTLDEVMLLEAQSNNFSEANGS